MLDPPKLQVEFLHLRQRARDFGGHLFLVPSDSLRVIPVGCPGVGGSWKTHQSRPGCFRPQRLEERDGNHLLHPTLHSFHRAIRDRKKSDQRQASDIPDGEGVPGHISTVQLVLSLLKPMILKGQTHHQVTYSVVSRSEDPREICLEPWWKRPYLG